MITWLAVKDYQQVTIHFEFCCVLQNWSKHAATSASIAILVLCQLFGWGVEGELGGLWQHRCATVISTGAGGPFTQGKAVFKLALLPRETLWRNRKNENSVPWVSLWNSPSYCPASQRNVCFLSSCREAVGSVHFFIDSVLLEAWDFCRDCCQYHSLVVCVCVF